jgi:NAD(P)-dependent dehydrogenase (short-subunit alcohol dehydrogenase family)
MFEQRAALVTGGASGIGRATARLLSLHGAHVVVADIDGPGARQVAAEVGGTAVELDVADAASWAVLERLDLPAPWGAVHLNAGVLTRAELPYEIDTVADAEVATAIGTDLLGVLYGLRWAVPRLEASGGGGIVATASLAGVAPFADDPVYAAAKHAVVGLATSVAEPLARRGVRVQVVCPGGTDTDLIDERRRALVAARGGVLQRPEVVAALVCRLLGGDGWGEVWAITPDRGEEQLRVRSGLPPAAR